MIYHYSIASGSRCQWIIFDILLLRATIAIDRPVRCYFLFWMIAIDMITYHLPGTRQVLANDTIRRAYIPEQHSTYSREPRRKYPGGQPWATVTVDHPEETDILRTGVENLWLLNVFYVVVVPSSILYPSYCDVVSVIVGSNHLLEAIILCVVQLLLIPWTIHY